MLHEWWVGAGGVVDFVLVGAGCWVLVWWVLVGWMLVDGWWVLMWLAACWCVVGAGLSWLLDCIGACWGVPVLL